MPRLAANLSMMFTEVPFLDRFAQAGAAGFEAVEYLFPYEYPAAEIRARLDRHGLRQVLFNAPPGDWSRGERGIACLPGREAEFREGIARALDYAAALSCPLLHVMAGIAPPGVAPDTLTARYGANLAWAVERARGSGIRIVLEPINRRDMPGYFLHRLDQAVALIAAVGEAGLQFDIYHCQVSEGDLTRRLETHFPHIAHIQIADVPDRHEPGTGEIGWKTIFGRIDALGYAGYVGCEYRPAGETVAGLAWRQKYGV